MSDIQFVLAAAALQMLVIVKEKSLQRFNESAQICLLRTHPKTFRVFESTEHIVVLQTDTESFTTAEIRRCVTITASCIFSSSSSWRFTTATALAWRRVRSTVSCCGSGLSPGRRTKSRWESSPASTVTHGDRPTTACSKVQRSAT